jgi:hypothetical protein
MSIFVVSRIDTRVYLGYNVYPRCHKRVTNNEL